MFCDKCGNQLNENEKVCPNCGNVIEETQPQANVDFTVGQPQNAEFASQQVQSMHFAQPTQPPKKKVDILKLLPIISNAIGVVSGILSVIFGIYVKNGNYGTYPYYIAGESYGGDAYTGIQNAAAHTANNVRSVYFLAREGAMFLLIVIGLIAIAAFLTKLIDAVKAYKNDK